MRAWIALAAALLAGPAAAQDMALTFDDLPVHSDLPPGETRLGVIARLVGGLADAGAPPSYGFVNAAGEAEAGGAEALRVWRAAGHPVGNHTWSHRRLEDPAAFEAEVARNEPALKALGGDWRWFRYPFLDEGATPELRAAARRILARRGYRVASVTLSFHDYAWNGPYARCAAKVDQAAIARLEESFLAAADQSLARAKALSREVAGREIPLVLLMHVGAFDARMLPRLLDLLPRARRAVGDARGGHGRPVLPGGSAGEGLAAAGDPGGRRRAEGPDPAAQPLPGAGAGQALPLSEAP